MRTQAPRQQRWKLLALAGVLVTWASATYAAAPATASGTIKGKGFLNIGSGTVVTDLTGNAKFPDKPDVVYYYPYFEWNATGDIDAAANNAMGDNYGCQMQGYFYPPSTGDYVFWTCSDDASSLYLSTDDDPANKKLIAVEQGWSNPRQWEVANGGAVEAKNSSTYTGTEWATKGAGGGAKITLTAGKAYYIEALMKEGGGGDNLAVAVQDPGGAIDSTLPIPGKYLSPFAPSTTAAILSQPAEQAVYAGGIANFSVGLDLPPGVTVTSTKWQKNGTDIPDSNALTLSLPGLTVADSGAKIKAVITTSAGPLTSAEANLWVASFSNEFAPGVVKFEAYTGINGTAVDNLLSDAKYPSSPDDVRLIAGIDSPNAYGDNYGARVSGFIIPPTSGSYRFFIRSDDASQLWLSTDDKEANAVMVCEETACCNAFTEPDSARTSEPINMTAGKKYYFYALVKEGGGGDFLQVAARKEGDTAAAASLPVLSGSWVGANAKPNLGDPTITKQPSAPAQIVEGNSVRLTIEAHVEPTAYNFPALLQWQKNGQDIAGATTSTYVIPAAAAADGGTYRCVVGAASGKTVNSADVTFAVVPDTFPPKIAGVGSLLKGSAVEIGVGFDEAVDSAAASAAANYTLSKGSVTAVRYQKYAHDGEAAKFVQGTTGPFNGYSVVLATSGIAAGDSVTVSVKGLKDVKGNTMAAAGESKNVTVTKKMKWAAMGGTDYVEGASTNPDGITAQADLWPDDAIAYSEADFDLISGGTANWNNYDEATFVYEEVTGDFDKVVRVEYHDPTSQWARAGMCATPLADEGITRAQVEGGYTMAQRYMLRCNPAVQFSGAAGNNQNEADWRDIAGGNYGGTGAGSPAYPNAWLRMQRRGQDFNAFYSADGKTWTAYGNHTFTESETTALMPAKLLVGVYYSPELNNNTAGPTVGHSTLARFRNYGDFGAAPPAGDATLSWAVSGKSLTITFTGTLQSADKVDGPWNNESSPSPATVNTASGTKYYRTTAQ